jgi:hypothetical protein
MEAATATIAAPEYEIKLKPPVTLLCGEPGTGKTTALTTYIEAGLELFVLITDPGGEEALLDEMQKRKLPMDKLHWNYVAASSMGWDVFEDMAKKIGSFSYADLSTMKSMGKDKTQQFMQMLGVMKDFKCQRTGKSYGPIDSFGADKAFALDSLSGVNTMALEMMTGTKPTAHEGEWGVAMNAEEKLIKKLCSDLKCFGCITAHVEREPDMLTGTPKIMVSALGRKLAPKLPKDFSDVVYAYREGSNFYWSTIASNVVLKARTLPLKDKLLPSFGQVVESFRKRLSAAKETQEPLLPLK